MKRCCAWDEDGEPEKGAGRKALCSMGQFIHFPLRVFCVEILWIDSSLVERNVDANSSLFMFAANKMIEDLCMPWQAKKPENGGFIPLGAPSPNCSHYCIAHFYGNRCRNLKSSNRGGVAAAIPSRRRGWEKEEARRGWKEEKREVAKK